MEHGVLYMNLMTETREKIVFVKLKKYTDDDSNECVVQAKIEPKTTREKIRITQKNGINDY